MQTVVIYDSRFGNTEKIAEAIARGVSVRSDVRIMHTTDALRAGQAFAERPDLVLVGGPTHNHGPSAGLKAFAEALPAPLRGAPAASFDTRYRAPVLLTGSAASAMAKVLAKAGAHLVAPAESFFIVRKGPLDAQGLEPGEIERAEQWGQVVAAAASQQLARSAETAG